MLFRHQATVGQTRGHISWVWDKGEIVGAALVTQDHVKPVFVSPGHGISLSAAITAVLELASRARLPEPLRHVDRAARACTRGERPAGVSFWGEIGTGVE